MDEVKLCRNCKLPMTRKDRDSDFLWQQRKYCGHLCQMRAHKKKQKTRKPCKAGSP